MDSFWKIQKQRIVLWNGNDVSLKKEICLEEGEFYPYPQDTRSWLEVLKKIGTFLVYVLAVVFIMLAFACGTIAFAEFWGIPEF